MSDPLCVCVDSWKLTRDVVREEKGAQSLWKASHFPCQATQYHRGTLQLQSSRRDKTKAGNPSRAAGWQSGKKQDGSLGKTSMVYASNSHPPVTVAASCPFVQSIPISQLALLAANMLLRIFITTFIF